MCRMNKDARSEIPSADCSRDTVFSLTPPPREPSAKWHPTRFGFWRQTDLEISASLCRASPASEVVGAETSRRCWGGC